MCTVSDTNMIHAWLVLLLTFVIVSGCQDNCCSSSTNCCDSTRCDESRSCCQQANCCQQTNCCQTTNCQGSNCCRICDNGCRSQSCATQCKQRCCQNEDCGTTTSTPTTSTTPTSWTPTRDTPPTPTPRRYIENGSSSSNINNGSVQATISMTNNLTNVNYIHVPIKITSVNSQSIQVVSIPAAVVPVVPIPNEPPTASTPCPTGTEPTITEPTSTNPTPSGPTTTTPCSTPAPETVPVAVPVPVYIPVYQRVPFPVYAAPQQGCCRVFSPCVSNQMCNPYQTMCGSQCTHSTMYAMRNPCEDGCYKKPYAPVRACTVFGICQVVMRNCNSCSDDFYTNYNSYQNCGGCYYK